MFKIKRGLGILSPVSFFVFYSFNCLFSQNLVPNPSFEAYTVCPSGPNQLPLATGWSAPPNNDTEYFSNCSTHPDYSVPNQSIYNYQVAKTGNAYSGCFLYNVTGFNYREYIQQQLASTLENNKSYYVSFWTNRASGPVGGKYAVNNVGLSFRSAFSDTTLNSTDPSLLNYPVNIQKFGNPIIKDTMDWVKIDGIYKAQGNENFLVIGNFLPDNQTNTFDMQDETHAGAFYFFDDVLVEAITASFWQYRDTTIQYGDSVLIGPAITGLDIDWYTSSMAFIGNGPGVYVKPATSRNYIAVQTFNGTETTHHVYVTVLGGVGIQENKLPVLTISPNPSDGIFTISIEGNEGWKIELRDLAGRQINISFENNQMDLSDFDRGVYNLTLSNEISGESICRSIVKK